MIYRLGINSNGVVQVADEDDTFDQKISTVNAQLAEILYQDADANLDTGKVYKIGGTQVVGAQGTALAGTATGGNASLINGLKARLEAHGLIAST